MPTNQEKFSSACSFGKLSTVKKLLKQKDVNINQASELGYTPLHGACNHNREDIFQFLLDNGADPCKVAMNGWGMLHAACTFGGNETMVEQLLALNVPVNQATDWGTPLHTACKEGNRGAVELLLAYGADMHWANKNGDIPVYFALIFSQHDIALLFFGRDDFILDANCYSIAEKHQQKYGDYIDAFTINYLENLRNDIILFNRDHPDEIFDFLGDDEGNPDTEKALMGYYVLRYLIRCCEDIGLSQLVNNIDIVHAIDQLITIPNVNNLVLSNATDSKLPENYVKLGPRKFAYQSNELLNLAVRAENVAIGCKLLELPAIKMAAMGNEFNGDNVFVWKILAKRQHKAIEVMQCLRDAAAEHREKSRSSNERKTAIGKQILYWERLSPPDLIKKVITMFKEGPGGWSKNAFRALVAWHIYNHYDEDGLKNKQLDILKDLPSKRGIRHNCNWYGNDAVPLLCRAFSQEFSLLQCIREIQAAEEEAQQEGFRAGMR